MRLSRMTRWIVPVLLVVAPVVHADATLAYKASFKPGAMLPPDTIKQATGSGLTSTNLVLQVKGDKELVSTAAGENDVIVDFTKQEITLLDAVAKQFCTVNASDYTSTMTSSMPKTTNIPPQVKLLLQMMKVNFSEQKTGKTELIQGVNTTETAWTLSLELPPGMLPLPGIPTDKPVVLFKLVGDSWVAAPGETTRVAALREIMSHKSVTSYMFNVDTVLKPLADYPNLHDSLEPILTRLTKDPPFTLRMDVQIFVPVAAQLAPLIQAQGKGLPPGMDLNAALGDMTMEATEISGAPVQASIFQIPASYQQVSMADFNKSKMKSATPVPASPVTPSSTSNSSTSGANPSARAAAAAAVLRNDH
jgi:hypothetical protein